MEIPQSVQLTTNDLTQIIGRQFVELAGKSLIIEKLTQIIEQLDAEKTQLQERLGIKPEACGEA